jgi:hypothetical protein
MYTTLKVKIVQCNLSTEKNILILVEGKKI